MNIKKEKIIQHFSKGAKTYDQAAIVQSIVAKRLIDFLPSINPSTVLEVGCGTGLLTQHLLERFPEANYLLTDIAPGMAKKAQERFQSRSNVAVLCADGEGMALPTPFDLITSSMTLHWFGDIAASLHHLTTRLTPGGYCVVAFLSQNALQEWRAICHDHALTASLRPLPTAAEIQRICPELKTQVETFQQTYDNLYAFLYSLKALGAIANRHDYVPMSTKQLRHLLRVFDQPIQMTYEVLYGVYQK